MGNPRIRGLVFLGVGLLAAWFFCVFLPFTALPAAGLGVGMPVITVPGEIIHYSWLGSFDLPNTLMGGFLASFLVILWVVLSYRSTNGWTREIPDRWQAWTEIFVETFYNFCDGLGGDKFRKAPLLWPITAAIFIFLLAGNWGKLLPGVESVGYIHCGYVGLSGYARYGDDESGGRLWVDRALDAGTTQTEELEEACAHQMKVLGIYYGSYDPADYAAEREAFYTRLAAIDGDVPDEFASATPIVPDATFTLTSNRATEAVETDAETALEPEPATGTCLGFAEREVAIVVEGSEAETVLPEAVVEPDEVEEAEDTEADEAEEADTEAGEATEEADTESASLLLTSTLATEEGDEEAGYDVEVETVAPEVVAAAFANLVEAEEAYDNGEITALALEDAQCEVTRMLHPGAVFPMSADELQDNNIQPYIFTIAPFFRGVATDLSFNIGLAVLAILAVQVYGVMALGPAYFEKFINVTALGNVGKRPAGLIDVIVGLIEIISEIGKIVSLAFRLFGNIFAGGVALVVVMFLVDFFIPGVILLLEIVIGLVQALVFAVLTLVFSVQAMEAHHGDDHDDHAEH